MKLFILLMLAPWASYAQEVFLRDIPARTEILYQTVFNMKFERDKQYMKYSSVLQTEGSRSVFYMLPGKSENSMTESEMTIELDTMFRVEKNLQEESMVFSDINLAGKESYYRDSIHPMQWKLTQDVKWIDSLECHKAETIFRGRKYTAWYCPAIPVPNGPWKLGGLPGLIIEAYEDNRDLYFMLSSLRNVSNGSSNAMHLRPPEKYSPYPVFQQYWREMSKRMQASLSAQDASEFVNCLSRSKVKLYSWEVIPD
jgi:GLPGLI family protein